MDVLKYISYGSSGNSSGSSSRCPLIQQHILTLVFLCLFVAFPSLLPHGTTFPRQTSVSSSAFRRTQRGGQRSVHFSRKPVHSFTYYSLLLTTVIFLSIAVHLFLSPGAWWDPESPSSSEVTTDWIVLKRLEGRSDHGRAQPTPLSQGHSKGGSHKADEECESRQKIQAFPATMIKSLFWEEDSLRTSIRRSDNCRHLGWGCKSTYLYLSARLLPVAVNVPDSCFLSPLSLFISVESSPHVHSQCHHYQPEDVPRKIRKMK